MSTPYERFAANAAIAAGVTAFLYAVAFVVLRNALLSGLFLMLLGLLMPVFLVAIYQRVRPVDEAFALWALLTGIAGGFGTAVHGGYDLALALNPPASNPVALANLPNQVDPRGLLTFAVTGISFLVIAWLIGRATVFSRGLQLLGYLAGALLVIIYLARLIILDPANPLLLAPVLLSGFIVIPLWNLWLGLALRRAAQHSQPTHPAPATH